MNKRVSSAVLTVILFIFSLLFSNVVSAVPVGIGDYVYSCGYDGFVNMRQEPSYSAGKVGKFYNGERAKVVGERGEDWKQVEVGSSVGWVPVKYIQTAPTLAYTGNVDVNWVEGIWDYNGSILMVFDNGTFVWGYDDETSHGVYIMQNNEIRFIPTWTEETLAGFDETLEINERSNMLGDYSRQHYLSQEDADEGYGGFGCLTRQEFKSFGKRLLAEVDREKVFNIYALKESAREEVQEAEEIEEAEETGGRSSDRDHSALFSWMWRILEILVGLALIALLMWGIMRLGRFLKEKKVGDKAKAAMNAAKESAISTAQTTKEKLTKTAEEVKQQVANLDVKNMPSLVWVFVLGAYILLFFSIILGLLILVPAIAYAIIRKKDPEKAESLLSSVKARLTPISSRPKLKRGLVLFISGLLVYKLVSMILGIILIVFAIVYLILSKYAAAASDKIDGALLQLDNGVKSIWAKPYAKVIICCLLLVFPFINKAPTNSIATVATPAIEQMTGIEPEKEMLKDSEIPSFHSPMDVILFLQGHTFRSEEDGIRLVVRQDAVYTNGTPLTTIPRVTDFSKDEAILEAHSPFNNSYYRLDLIRRGNTYLLKVSSLPSFKYITDFYMID